MIAPPVCGTDLLVRPWSVYGGVRLGMLELGHVGARRPSAGLSETPFWVMRPAVFGRMICFAAMDDNRGHSVECETVAAGYRQLAEIYHDLLTRDGVEQLLERLVKTVRDLIPVTSILLAETVVEQRVLVPLVAAGEWPDGFLTRRLPFGEGLIGMAAERGRPILSNEAHRDSRAGHVSGTPEGEPEAIISLPLLSRGTVIGALSLYREGEQATFSEFEFEMAQRFADAATLALENARVRTELRELTRRDELTGLLNRRGFSEQITRALAASDAPSQATALLLVDLNDFKHVNDSRGHPCGDQLLCHVAQLLQQVTRNDDDVCRLGGDEFAIVLSDAQPGEAELTAKRISAALSANPMRYDNQTIHVNASVGYAYTGSRNGGAGSLMREADQALYRSKPTQPIKQLRLVKEA